MREIVLPADELNEFDLPRVCVVTGQTENVEFKPVKFAWYPRWVAALVIVNVLIAAIVATILTRRVKGHLPFTEEAYKSWRMGRVFLVLSILGAVALFVASCVALAEDTPQLGVLGIVLSFAVPITVGILFVRNKGPVVQRIADGRITLKLPSEEAVLRIEQHMVAGEKKPSAYTATARSA